MILAIFVRIAEAAGDVLISKQYILSELKGMKFRDLTDAVGNRRFAKPCLS